jgi:phosphoadenosine phosphosulfate reductase
VSHVLPNYVLPDHVDERDAASILSWAESEFGDGLVLTSSFENPVLPHLVASNAPSASIVLIDTQYLFTETLEYVDTLENLLGIDIQIQHPEPDVRPDKLWQTNIEACCEIRKVRPLQKALQWKTGWISGLRRSDGFERANAPIVSFDQSRTVTKINPLALWSDDDVESYIKKHDLPINPLTALGYASIGCWPCTRPIKPGESRRDGRWSGQDKTECGLHTQVVQVRTSSSITAETSSA